MTPKDWTWRSAYDLESKDSSLFLSLWDTNKRLRLVLSANMEAIEGELKWRLCAYLPGGVVSSADYFSASLEQAKDQAIMEIIPPVELLAVLALEGKGA